MARSLDSSLDKVPQPEGVYVGPPGGFLIPWADLGVKASRSGGPGGQHVNTSSTRVEMSWNIRQSPLLNDDARRLLLAALASKLDSDGSIRVVASDTRSQRSNRDLAGARLAALVRDALTPPKPRKKTKRTYSSVQRRLDTKKKHSSKKRERRSGGDD